MAFRITPVPHLIPRGGRLYKGHYEKDNILVIQSLPTFRELVAHSPDPARFPTPALLNSIGGDVRARLRDGDNTCAIRLSHALNKAGAALRPTPGLHMLKSAPQTISGMAHHAHPATKTDLYIYRVLEMKRYLDTRYGEGVRIYNGYHPHQLTQPPHLQGATQGIIAFTWEGRFNDFSASGHMDLYRGLLIGDPQALGGNCIGECYFNIGPMVADFWEVCH